MGPLDIEEKEERDLSWSDIRKGIGTGFTAVGDAFEWVDDQVGIPGTNIDVKHARNLITDPLDKIHPVAGLVGEILVPDSTDLLAGSGYVKRAVKNVPEITRALRKTNLNKMLGDVFDTRIPNPFKAKELLETGAGLGPRSGDVIRGYGSFHVPPNASEVYKTTQKLLNENVLVGPNRTFDYNAFKALFTGNKRGRLLEGWMMTTPHFQVKNWDKHRQELVDVFESIYGDVMQLKGIPRSQIQIDHLVTLRSTMPIYDGVAFGSPLWNKIQETFLRSTNKYNPGNTLANLDALDPGSHIVKTNFFNKRIGKDGSKFFNKKILYDGKMIKRSEYMKLSDANRIEVLNDFIKIQDEGTLILREAQNVWETLYKIDSAEMPKSILDKLSKIPIGEFSHPELRKENLNQLRAIITDIVQSGAKRGRKKKIGPTLKRLFPDVDPNTGDIQGTLPFDK